MDLREFRRKHGVRERLWQIWVNGDTIHTCHGWSAGVMQHNLDIPGKSSRESAEERAISRAEKLIKDKLNKGYTEYVPGTDSVIGDAAGTEVDFIGAPPDGLEVFKPRTTPKDGSPQHKKMMEVINKGNDIITRKYNGMKHLLVVTVDAEYKLYTRRMEDATEHYPHLIDEFELLDIPSKTIIALELYVPGSDGVEDFRTMQSLSRSLPLRAQQLQLDNPNIRPHATLLAPVYWAGEPIIKQMKVFDWMGVLEGCVCSAGNVIKKPFIHSMQVFYGGLAKAFDHVKSIGLEGLVVYDGEACFGDRAFNFRGKSDRPDCWKQKPLFEEDFVAVFDPFGNKWLEGGSFGSGKNMKRPKSVALYQYDKKGELVYVSHVGSGFDDKLKEEIAKVAADEGYWSAVVAVEYAERKFLRNGDISNALTFASFQKIHEDKAPHECINDYL